MNAANDANELSMRQRFELAMLGDELSNPERRYEDALADLVRYAMAEGITPAMFCRRDREGGLISGYLAAMMRTIPQAFPADSSAGRALIAVGLTPKAADEKTIRN